MKFGKRVFVLIFIVLILIGMLSAGFVYAKYEKSGRGKEVRLSPDDEDREDNNDEREDKEEYERRVKIKDGEIEERIKSKIENDRERVKKINEFRKRIKENDGLIEIEERVIKIKEIDEEKKEIIAGKINAKTGLNLTADDIGDGSTGQILRAYLSNGRFAIVKIMPDGAAEIALKKLRAKCLDRNCTIELKEIREGNDIRAVYELKTEKDARVFLLFKKKMKVRAVVDTETGEIIFVKKPWWAFIAREKHENEQEIENETGEDDVGAGDKVTICHIPPGNPAAKHTIVVGAPAVRVHLAHGDYLGRCAGDNGNETMSGNETSPGNQSTGNVTIPGNQTNQTVNLIADMGIGSVA